MGREVLRRQCEAERAALTIHVVDLEAGLAEQARLLAEAQRAARALEERIRTVELSLTNVAGWLQQQHEETAYDRVRRAVRRLAQRGV